MICVPDAFALPAELFYSVFVLQPLDNTTELLSYGADCHPPPMMPAETFSSVPAPRHRLMQQTLRMPHLVRNIRYHVPVNGRHSCAEKGKGVLDEAAMVPLHPIHERIPPTRVLQTVVLSMANTIRERRYKLEEVGNFPEEKQLRTRSVVSTSDQEWRKLEKLALGFPLFSAQFRHS